MDNNDRKQDILNVLYKSGRVSVKTLSKTLYVSEMTIRRDLTEMEKGGYIKRYRGGAILKADAREMPITERFLIDANEKVTLFVDGSLCSCHHGRLRESPSRGAKRHTNRDSR